MDKSAVSVWREWVASDEAIIHIRAVIARLVGYLKPSDRDDLIAEVQIRLLTRDEDYDPARSSPVTFGNVVIPRTLIDVLRWLGAHCRDRRRLVELSEIETMRDLSSTRGVVRKERNEAIHAALKDLDEITRRFAERLMTGMPPSEAGAHAGWSEQESKAALERLRTILTQAGVTAGDQ